MIQHKTIQDYLDSLSETTREKVIELREIVQQAIPSIEENMAYGVPCFNLIPNATLEQKIMIGGFKKHVSFYPHPTTIDAFRSELSGFTLRKGTIQFKLTDELPVSLIQRMTKHRYEVINGKQS
jgi:uncharacterized protein YdhG (YjbR/CyaY superfamily)